MDRINKLICLTPVKNEAWILDKFLSCASLWADHIIIANQLSDDGSLEIAKRYPKVILVENNSSEFNEPERQKLLLSEGRKIEGPKVFFTLDADEFLTANFKETSEWPQILTAQPGTVFRFNWVNLLPGFKRGWIIGNSPWAFVDDGTAHDGHQIHSPRIPLPEHGKYIDLTEIKVLHYQYTDWKRMQSKHCWYQCYECINYPGKRIVTLYRMYHHMYVFLKRKKFTSPLDEKWFEFYEEKNIVMKEVKQQEFWWDKEVLKLMQKYGTKKFSNAFIWYRDWNTIRDQYNPQIKMDLRDPRTILQKALHFYLHTSQPYRNSIPVRAIDKALRIAGF